MALDLDTILKRAQRWKKAHSLAILVEQELKHLVDSANDVPGLIAELKDARRQLAAALPVVAAARRFRDARIDEDRAEELHLVWVVDQWTAQATEADHDEMADV